jgi:hypothetical protein
MTNVARLSISLLLIPSFGWSFTQQNRNLSPSDQYRLLLTEPALTAFIVAEVEEFVNRTMIGYDEGLMDGPTRKWTLPHRDQVDLGLIDAQTGQILSVEYESASSMDPQMAVQLLVETTRAAFSDGVQQEPGLLSALGSAICYFRNYYRATPLLIAACERVGLSDYAIAHHITDMYHHRQFQGAYTKTLPPSGRGEIAARLAVGLPLLPHQVIQTHTSTSGGGGGDDRTVTAGPEATMMSSSSSTSSGQVSSHDDDECLVWSPTTPDVCLHWKSDNEVWRAKRFERIQMEGTKDPRRGGSGTTR